MICIMMIIPNIQPPNGESDINKELGRKMESKLIPILTPHIGTPIPHTCNTEIPNMLAIIPNIDPLFCFLLFTLSLIFLMVQAIVKAKRRTNGIARNMYDEYQICLGTRKYPRTMEKRNTNLQYLLFKLVITIGSLIQDILELTNISCQAQYYSYLKTSLGLTFKVFLDTK